MRTYWSALAGVCLLVVTCLPAAGQVASYGEPGLALMQPPSVAPSADQPIRLPPVDELQATAADVPLPAPEAASEDALFGRLESRLKDLAWTKGDFKIVPYGILWGNTAYETQWTTPGDFTLFAISPDVRDGDAFQMNARATRIGFDVTGPRIPLFHCAQSGGKVEIDFHGNALEENRATILLRHAYWEVKDEEFRILMGQTWDVISPLLPGMFMYSVGWGGGNIGFRRAQLRGERYFAWSDELLITAQGSLNADLSSDFVSDPLVLGDHSGWPLLEGRLGLTLGPRGKDCLPITCGISSHVGEIAFFSLANPRGETAQTWSFNGDLRVPITRTCGVQGECFVGENLGTFLGGIIQGVNSVTLDPIASRGGWCDFWWDFCPRWHYHVGAGIDDPVNDDVTAGRTYNQFTFTNISYDVTKMFVMGLEISHWDTMYDTRADATSTRIEYVAQYKF